MITDTDLKQIKPKPPSSLPSAAQVDFGILVPKPARVRIFSATEWAKFIEEWATSLENKYEKVRRLGGSGDYGVDIAAFADKSGFNGVWDNFQCKHYGHPLRPSDIWVEIGKAVYYSHIGAFIPPRRYFFICSQGISTSLEKMLNNSPKLKSDCKLNWAKYCKSGITDTVDTPLDGALLAYFEAFDFSIFSSKSPIELIEGHAQTGYHAVRFGGGLPARPNPTAPPSKHQPEESRYLRQLLEAYGDHLGTQIASAAELAAYAGLQKDFIRQRERFYSAEALRNFARDTVPNGTFDALQDEIYHGVADVCDGEHSNGYERMKGTVAQAAQVSLTANPLSPATRIQDRQGICHQLANTDRLTWVPSDE